MIWSMAVCQAKYYVSAASFQLEYNQKYIFILYNINNNVYINYQL